MDSPSLAKNSMVNGITRSPHVHINRNGYLLTAPRRKICSITAHLGLKISLGALCNIHRLAGDLLQVPAEAIQQFVLKQKQLNADESSWRVMKKRCWIWIGATSKATFFKIGPSRSAQAYRRIFGSYCGTLTTDRHGAYAERGLRLAVILRKLSGGNQSDWGARFIERLMTVVCTLKQNAMNTFTFLTEVFAAHQKARSPPFPVL